jgi:hypothetical protein
MTEEQIKLIHAWGIRQLSIEELKQQFPEEQFFDREYIEKSVRNSIETNINLDEASILVQLANYDDFTELKNKLLIIPGHREHQSITKDLQDIGDPSSIPFIEQILENGFDYLSYTCSEDAVIAKWFSYALWSIGTPEAIALIEKYSKSSNEGIREEMLYRLKRIEEEA